MTPIHTSVLSTIGNTPVIRLNALAPEGVELFVKAESFNPGGSVKDRLALGIIEAAERDGSLKPGQTVIEATSGNTGIGLAIVCAAKGYPLVVVMAESFSIERRKLLRMLGAKVVLTPASEKGTGMLAKARELAEAHGWFLARQFENEAGPDIHSATTAEEIVASFRRRPAGLFRDRLRHGRDAQGRRPRAQSEEPDNQGHRRGAGERPAARLAHRAGLPCRRLSRLEPPGLPPASDARLDAGLHSEADP
jgi:cysteine synthase A